MYINITKKDSFMRVVIGILLIILGTQNMFLLMPLGVMAIFSGYFRYCPMCHFKGLKKRAVQQEYYRSLLPQNNPEPVFIFNETGYLLYQNESSKVILPSVSAFNDIFNDDAKEMIEQEGKCTQSYIEDELTYIINAKGDSFNRLVFAYGFNVSELAQKKEELQQQLITDALTGLANRIQLINDLQGCSEKAQLLMLIDLKGFGQYNSFYGYKIGDGFLQAFAQELQHFTQTKKAKCTEYRLQADQFAILIDVENTKQENLRSYAEDVETQLKSFFKHKELAIDGINLEVDFIVASASTLACGLDSKHSTLLNNAETTLIEAKKLRTNSLFYGDILNVEERFKENLYWSKKIKEALANKNGSFLTAFFQPIYNNETKQIEKYETLVRLIDQDKVISPFHFLEPAKKLNLIEEITHKVFTLACQKFENTEYEFSVNITYDDLKNKDFFNFVTQTAQKYNIVRKRIVLEILEDEDMYAVLDAVQQFKQAGFKIAIDDFGVGYSNFAKLQQIRADYIKIDGSLIKHLDENENDQVIIESITSYAKSIGAKTIAEFVSKESIYDAINKKAIDYAQGYFIGEPKAELKEIHAKV